MIAGQTPPETCLVLGEAGGKSEHHRAGCRVIPGRGDPEESATESKPPPTGPSSLLPHPVGSRGMEKRGFASAESVRLKGCGKSAPAPWVTLAARQTPSGARSIAERRGLLAPSSRVDRLSPPVPSGLEE